MKTLHLIAWAVVVGASFCVLLITGQTPRTAEALSPPRLHLSSPGWEEVGIGSASGGGISNNNGASQYPKIDIASDGVLYVAWDDNSSGNYEIYVKRWKGGIWEEVGTGSASGGGISNDSSDSRYPSVAIAPDGTPYVTWQNDTSEDDEIYVRRWNGVSWEEVGVDSASGGGISNNSGSSRVPRVAAAPDGTPYVAWEDWSTSDAEIYIRHWNGSLWAEVGAGSASDGGVSDNNTWSGNHSLTIAPDGTPYVTWADYVGGDDEIYARRWNGSSWAEVGVGSASGGGISNNNGSSTGPSVAVGSSGMPYVAWNDASSGDNEIYVRRWNGNGWEEVGVGSASGGGISNNSGASWTPWAAAAPDGKVYVAWHDDSGGDTEIYVRRWSGTWWEEVGVGSASGGGISDNSADSYGASSAIGPDGTVYVAWHDVSNGDAEIYVRRYGSGGMVFLPLVLKGPATSLTKLSVRNLTSGVLYVYRVYKGSTVFALCTNIQPGDTQVCGSFAPGCYDAYVDTAECGEASAEVCFPAGNVIREVRCQ